MMLPLLLALWLPLALLAQASGPRRGEQLRQAALAHAHAQATLAADSALDAGQRWLCRQLSPPAPVLCGGPGRAGFTVCAQPLADALDPAAWRLATPLPAPPLPEVSAWLHIAALPAPPLRYRLSALGQAGDSRQLLQRDIAGLGPACRRLDGRRL